MIFQGIRPVVIQVGIPPHVGTEVGGVSGGKGVRMGGKGVRMHPDTFYPPVYDPYGRTTVTYPDGAIQLPPLAKSYYHDADLDGDVDAADQAHLAACMLTPYEPMCVFVHDRNGNDKMDPQDASLFEACAGTPLDPCSLRPPVPVFDANGDGELEAFDWYAFHTCFGVSGAPNEQLCEFVFDINGDSTIDLDDYAEFQRAYGGPGVGRFAGSATVDASRFANPFTWTGQRFDAAVALCHFTYRSYSTALGRWLQRDPLGFIDSPNAYEYSRSAPAGFLDPFGLSPITPKPFDPFEFDPAGWPEGSPSIPRPPASGAGGGSTFIPNPKPGGDPIPVYRFDKFAKPHGGVPTPHTHPMIPHRAPDGNVFPKKHPQALPGVPPDLPPKIHGHEPVPAPIEREGLHQINPVPGLLDKLRRELIPWITKPKPVVPPIVPRFWIDPPRDRCGRNIALLDKPGEAVPQIGDRFLKASDSNIDFTRRQTQLAVTLSPHCSPSVGTKSC